MKSPGQKCPGQRSREPLIRQKRIPADHKPPKVGQKRRMLICVANPYSCSLDHGLRFFQPEEEMRKVLCLITCVEVSLCASSMLFGDAADDARQDQRRYEQRQQQIREDQERYDQQRDQAKRSNTQYRQRQAQNKRDDAQRQIQEEEEGQ